MSTVFTMSLIFLVLMNVCWCDTAPNINYSHNMRILKIPLGTPVGTLIYRLKGSDPDGDALTFGSVDPVGSSLLYFQSASFTEADVYLKAPLTVSDCKLSCLPLSSPLVNWSALSLSFPLSTHLTDHPLIFLFIRSLSFCSFSLSFYSMITGRSLQFDRICDGR